MTPPLKHYLAKARREAKFLSHGQLLELSTYCLAALYAAEADAGDDPHAHQELIRLLYIILEYAGVQPYPPAPIFEVVHYSQEQFYMLQLIGTEPRPLQRYYYNTGKSDHYATKAQARAAAKTECDRLNRQIRL